MINYICIKYYKGCNTPTKESTIESNDINRIVTNANIWNSIELKSLIKDLNELVILCKNRIDKEKYEDIKDLIRKLKEMGVDVTINK